MAADESAALHPFRVAGCGETGGKADRCVSGNLEIGFALAATNDLDDGGCRFRVGIDICFWVGLRKKLKKLGFNFFSFVLVH